MHTSPTDDVLNQRGSVSLVEQRAESLGRSFSIVPSPLIMSKNTAGEENVEIGPFSGPDNLLDLSAGSHSWRTKDEKKLHSRFMLTCLAGLVILLEMLCQLAAPSRNKPMVYLGRNAERSKHRAVKAICLKTYNHKACLVEEAHHSRPLNYHS